ncbi:hypothetical protein ATANTOWER_029323 [Ataeniobius toweri]|uniref:N-acetyltransferase domain-containing protein n=1 Tax=Ataeniobius toweri TaxID=208326 RepID=A0ABU7B9W1_9TELE|nr:hypothetical protein [Ataeniobius toweri]
MQCFLTFKHLVSSDQTTFFQHVTGLYKYCSEKHASTCFFFSSEVLRAERAYRSRGLGALLWISLKKLYALKSCREPWLVYDVMIFFTLPDYGNNSSHWKLQFEMFLLLRPSGCFAEIKMQRS